MVTAIVICRCVLEKNYAMAQTHVDLLWVDECYRIRYSSTKTNRTNQKQRELIMLPWDTVTLAVCSVYHVCIVCMCTSYHIHSLWVTHNTAVVFVSVWADAESKQTRIAEWTIHVGCLATTFRSPKNKPKIKKHVFFYWYAFTYASVGLKCSSYSFIHLPKIYTKIRLMYIVQTVQCINITERILTTMKLILWVSFLLRLFCDGYTVNLNLHFSHSFESTANNRPSDPSGRQIER